MLQRCVLAIAALVLLARPATAIPVLQLDIDGGIYDPRSETIVTTAPEFTLYAFLIPDDRTAFLTDTYYLSVALTPITGEPGGSFGSFSLDGTSYRVTEDMTYGRPPIEDLEEATSDAGDLPKHGIYSTYFREFAFNFNAANRVTAYNTAKTTGAGPTPDAAGTMYFHSFQLDVSNLQAGYGLHFDLYNVKELPNGDRDIEAFAPFSHDAAYVPEPGGLLLLGTGLAALAARRRRRTG